MKTAEVKMERGDFRVYCYINGVLDKVAVLPTYNSAIDYLEKYVQI